MFEWRIVSSLQFFIFGSVKNNVYKTFAQFLKLCHCRIIWFLFAGTKDHNLVLCSREMIREICILCKIYDS